MKIYLLIPLCTGKVVATKEGDHVISRHTLNGDYLKHFGEQNEYYVDWTSQIWELSGIKDAHLSSFNGYYYNAMDPRDMIKKEKIG